MSELLNLNLETVSEISALELRDRDGKYVVQIKNDGTLIFAPGITPDKASEQFWRSIAIAFPEAFVSRQTYADLERENTKLRAKLEKNKMSKDLSQEEANLAVAAALMREALDLRAENNRLIEAVERLRAELKEKEKRT